MLGDEHEVRKLISRRYFKKRVSRAASGRRIKTRSKDKHG